jgi:hypothetical protein
MDPAPFLRGNPFPGNKHWPYPRFLIGDGRLPGDSQYMGGFPVGVRLELQGDADEIEISYRCKHTHAVWAQEAGALWEAGSGRAFEAWDGDERLGIARAEVGEGTVRLPRAPVVYLPERLAPEVTSIEGIGGSLEPGPARPAWICYGDSIAEGWIASSPALSWPSIVARAHGLDLFNMSYAGAARGELCSAEQIAGLPARAISLSHGTNCWNRVPHSAELMRESTRAFLALVRRGHPGTPLVVCTPPIRPEAEERPNELGATLADLRAAMVDACAGYEVEVVEGRDLIDPSMLYDNVHPDDDGHHAIAEALGPVLAKAVVA